MALSQMPKLTKPICRKVYERTWGQPTPSWIALETVLSALMIPHDQNVDEAISHAVARNWLVTEGDPVSSLAITEHGIATLKPVARRPSSRRKFPLA